MAKKRSTFSHLILRDFLSVDRTRLANERTLLAYVRTSLTLVVAGVSGYNLFLNAYMRLFGLLFVVLGVVVMLIGVFRYRTMNRALSKIGKPDYARVEHPIVTGHMPKALTGQGGKNLVEYLG